MPGGPPPPGGPGGGPASGPIWRRLVLGGLVIAVIVVGVLLLTTGDDDDSTNVAADGGTTSTTPRASTSTTEEPAPETTVPPTTRAPAAGEDESGTADADARRAVPTDMEDGEHFVFIRSVDESGRVVTFDLAQFFTGEQAQQAAEEDGAVQPGEPVPNDYYIRNVNDRLRDLSFRRNVRLRIVDWEDCCDLVPGDLEPFADAFDPDADTSGAYRGPESPYFLTVRRGVVTEIEEVFLP